MKINYIGFFTLFKREFLRFFTVPNNTIFPQMVSALFYFLIFGIAIGNRIELNIGVPYLLFILPGLFVQNLINGSYSNPSGSLFTSRSWGNISDMLLAPISYLEFTIAIILAAILRGILLGLGTVLIALFFVKLSIYHPLILIAYILLISFLFACCGIIIGLWAKTWEQLNVFLNFIVTPLTFLGGVFYTLDMVPNIMATITKFNPVYYMINGTRYGMLGIKEGNIYIGIFFLIILNILLFTISYYLIKKGYNLKT